MLKKFSLWVVASCYSCYIWGGNWSWPTFFGNGYGTPDQVRGS